MAQWTNKDEANGAPKFTTNATTGESGIQEYGSEVFGYLSTENDGSEGLASPGWVRVVKGPSTLNSVAINAGGTGYSNTLSSFTLKDSANTTLGTGTVTTNGSGVITAINYTAANTQYNGSISATWSANNAGTGATFTYNTIKGRIRSETLVAMRGMKN